MNQKSPSNWEVTNNQRACQFNANKAKCSIYRLWFHFCTQSKAIQRWAGWLIALRSNTKIFNERHSIIQIQFFISYRLQIKHAVLRHYPSVPAMNKFVLCSRSSLLFPVKYLSTDADHPINSLVSSRTRKNSNFRRNNSIKNKLFLILNPIKFWFSPGLRCDCRTCGGSLWNKLEECQLHSGFNHIGKQTSDNIACVVSFTLTFFCLHFYLALWSNANGGTFLLSCCWSLLAQNIKWQSREKNKSELGNLILLLISAMSRRAPD